jgi:hypothetical protein
MGKEYYLIPDINQMQEHSLVPDESAYKVKDIPLVPSTEN